MSKQKQSLKQAVVLARTPGTLIGRCCGLEGLPIGDWPATKQAMAQLMDALPLRSQRSYTAAELVDALYGDDGWGRYRSRGDVFEADETAAYRYCDE